MKKEKKQLSWREITLVGIGLEFMFQVQEDGKLIGLYTGSEMNKKGVDIEWYGAKDEPNSYNFLHWEVRTNALYIHCPDNGLAKYNALKALALSNDLFLMSADMEDDREYMLKLINRYNLDTLFKKVHVGDDVFNLGE